MNQNISKAVEDYLNLMEKAPRRYQWAYEQVGIEDKHKSDLEHAIELNKGGAKVRNQLAKELETCLRDRRYFKDIVEETVVLAEYVKLHGKSLEGLKKTLGDLRRVESYHACRTYKPRIRKERGVDAG